MNDQLRTLVRGAYDVQKLRIQMGNRVVGNFKARLGQAPGQAEEELDVEGKQILQSLRTSYRRMMDGVLALPSRKSFKGDEVINSYTEFCLVAQYMELETSEAEHFKRLAAVLEDYPIYTKFLKKVSGVGPAMAGVILSEFDISKARYPSSLWKYAGLDVAPDGLGRSKKKQHLVKVAYIDREGKEQERDGITFNPFLKSKLMGVLAGSFLKVKESPYKDRYYEYKNRLEHHPVHKEKTKGHRHAMALRYMVKRFLVDLYIAWRTMEGLDVAPEYSEGKLGMVHREEGLHA